jgi:GT2 family glycosyltransferase
MSAPIHFLAVIGLYQTSADNSVAFQSLKESCSELTRDRARVNILLYDNTPGKACSAEIAPNIRYYTNGRNDGLAVAFNFALKMAVVAGCDWLITLDQDTTFPANFLTRIAEVADRVKDDPQIAAIVPQISGEGRILSPNWFWAGAIPRWFPQGFVGVAKHPTYAFNSGSTLRISALREIGGYSPWFWLDHCDSLLYHELNRRGKKIFIAGDLQVNHNFSMLDKNTRMSGSRYHNMLLSEAAFWDLAMNPLARAERAFRLLGRLCRSVITRDSVEFRKETALALKQRLLSSKASRLELWKNEMKALQPYLADVPEPPNPVQKRGIRLHLKNKLNNG